MLRFFGIRAVALIMTLNILLNFWGGTAVAETGGIGSAEVERLYGTFGIKNVSANYIIAIDTSLSMAPNFSQTREAVNALTRSLRPGDSVTVISFSNKPKVIYSGRVGKTTKALITRLPDAPDPDGQRTDIGAAIGSVLGRTRHSRSDLQLVFFLTDGRNEPPAESGYQTDDRGSWSKLKEAAAAGGKVIKVHGIGLGADTDVNLLQRVFPDSNRITVSPPQLKSYFTQLKNSIRVERLKIKVDRELKEGRVKIDTVGGSEWGKVKSGQVITRRYRVTSTYKKLPVDVVLGRPEFIDLSDRSGPVKKADFKLTLIGAGRFRLKAGESRVVRLKLTVPEFENKLRLGQISNGFNGRVDFGMRREVVPRSAITILGLNPKGPTDIPYQRVSFFHLIGQSPAILAALAVAVLLIAAVLAKTLFMPLSRFLSRRISPPPLEGRITFIKAPPGQLLPPPVSLSGLGSKADIGTAGKITLMGAGVADRHAELFTAWEEGNASVHLRKLEGDARVATSARESGRPIIDEVKLKRGSVIEIGGYKMQWV